MPLGHGIFSSELVFGVCRIAPMGFGEGMRKLTFKRFVNETIGLISISDLLSRFYLRVFGEWFRICFNLKLYYLIFSLSWLFDKQYRWFDVSKSIL